LTVAAGGLAGANLFAFVPGVVQFAVVPERALQPAHFARWMHAGWVVGAGIALFGAVMHRLVQRRRTGKQPRGLVDRRRSRRRAAESFRHRSRSVVASVAWGGIGGGLVGAMFGASLLLLWFSLAYSPFSPAGWSVSIERSGRRTASGREHFVATTSHPIALWAFCGPALLGASAAAIASGVGRIAQGTQRSEQSGIDS
jgi:hypothetical protein